MLWCWGWTGKIITYAIYNNENCNALHFFSIQTYKNNTDIYKYKTFFSIQSNSTKIMKALVKVYLNFLLPCPQLLWMQSSLSNSKRPSCRRMRVLYMPKPLRLHRDGWVRLSGRQCACNHTLILLHPLSFVSSKRQIRLHRSVVQAFFWKVSCYGFR